MAVVAINLTHSIHTGHVKEKRFQLTSTIAEIKANIATHFATPADQMRLVLKDESGTVIESNMLNEKMFGYYQPIEDYTIHIVDLQENGKWTDWDDVSKVEKFRMSDDDYDKRTNSVRALKRIEAERKRKEAEAAGIELAPELDADSFKEQAEKMKEGDRCQCQPGDRLGTVKYVGRIVALKPGFWIGVEFDEPVGKSDGSAKGVQVFSCRPNYGGFLRPDQVEVGDFPEEEF